MIMKFCLCYADVGRFEMVSVTYIALRRQAEFEGILDDFENEGCNFL